MVSENLSEDL